MSSNNDVLCNGSLDPGMKGTSLSHSSLNNFPSSTALSHKDFMNESGGLNVNVNGPLTSSWSAPNALSGQINGWTSGQEP